MSKCLVCGDSAKPRYQCRVCNRMFCLECVPPAKHASVINSEKSIVRRKTRLPKDTWVDVYYVPKDEWILGRVSSFSKNADSYAISSVNGGVFTVDRTFVFPTVRSEPKEAKTERVSEEEKTCTCKSIDLFNFGCKCGAI